MEEMLVLPRVLCSVLDPETSFGSLLDSREGFSPDHHTNHQTVSVTACQVDWKPSAEFFMLKCRQKFCFLSPRRVLCCWRVSSSESLLLNLSLLISWGFKTSETLASAAVERCTRSESAMKRSTDTLFRCRKKIHNPQTLESFCINY